MDVIMPEGITYILVIETNKYAGNFERDLCLYATGLLTPEFDLGPYDQNILDMAGISTDNDIARKGVVLQNHDGKSVVETLRATPERYNDGMGGHFDISLKKDGERAWPAYESIAIFFEKPLSHDEINAIRGRAEEFAAKNLGGKGLQIKRVYQTQYKVVAVETPYDPTDE